MISYQKHLLRDLNTWFNDLTELARTIENNSGLPKLELFLHNNQTITGTIIESIKNNQESLLMIMEYSNRQSEPNIILIKSSQIIGIKLIDPDQFLRLFSATENSETIGNLQFTRAVNDIQNELNHTSSLAINILYEADSYTNRERHLVLNTLKLIPPIIASMTFDSIGRKLVSEKIKNIKISIGTENISTLSKQNLHLQISDLGFFSPLKETEKLKTSIESLL